jgi:hypothetical protein
MIRERKLGRMREKRIAYRIFGGGGGGSPKVSVIWPKRKLEDNINTDLKGVESEVVGSIYLAQDRKNFGLFRMR